VQPENITEYFTEKAESRLKSCT